MLIVRPGRVSRALNPDGFPRSDHGESMQYSYRQLGRQVKACGYTLAVPSWVWPGTVAENCEKLAGLFPEVALMFLETEACLAYGGKDLPPRLADLSLSWHVHFPVDLDWRNGGQRAMDAVISLADKAAYLNPHAFVLHPPPGPAEERRPLLEKVVAKWRDSGREPGALLLENTREVGAVEAHQLARELGTGLCLDLGHIMAYEQALPALSDMAGRIGMVHLSAPGPNAEHLSLARLNPAGETIACRLIGTAGRGTVLTLEIFEPGALFESAAWLAAKIEEWGL
jgi:hypothetical protein